MSFSREGFRAESRIESDEASNFRQDLNLFFTQKAKILFDRRLIPDPSVFAGIAVVGSLPSRLLLTKEEQAYVKQDKSEQGLIKTYVVWGNEITDYENVTVYLGEKMAIRCIVDGNGIYRDTGSINQLEDREISLIRSWLKPESVLWAPMVSKHLTEISNKSLNR